ncbi:hypothetical protein Pmani_026244 [Petrolisthes manimaculis]|uniref:Uncharacterized protein n=1 Tax=Petrolisthes manimaculis TaxID=1843537 RepID=A0AAE1P5J2_9EUCA|nr:hypothetical protein Pmani_026244 [Petrolisthes manimaculis]
MHNTTTDQSSKHVSIRTRKSRVQSQPPPVIQNYCVEAHTVPRVRSEEAMSERLRFKKYMERKMNSTALESEPSATLSMKEEYNGEPNVQSKNYSEFSSATKGNEPFEIDSCWSLLYLKEKLFGQSNDSTHTEEANQPDDTNRKGISNVFRYLREEFRKYLRVEGGEPSPTSDSQGI